MHYAAPLRAAIAAVTLAFAAGACGGTVVFDADGDGGGNRGSGGNGVSSTSSNVGPTTGIGSTGVVGPTSSVGPGGGLDNVTSVGPGGDGGAGPGQGPGPGPGPGPSGGGFDPTGTGGAGPGPSGVGGADVGPSGAVGVSTSGGCNQFLDETNQYCYLAETCEDYRLEMECRLNGASPYACWCYQDSRYVGQCDQMNVGCSTNGCCSDFWDLPG